jgi:hypothetical protein
MSPTSSRGHPVALWIVQGLNAVVYVGTAVWKFATPVPTLAGMIPWAGEVPPAFLYFTAAVDLAGGVGIVVPSLLRVWPRLTVAAAVGCTALQVCAVLFHVARGEVASTPFNVLMGASSAWVAWARSRH